MRCSTSHHPWCSFHCTDGYIQKGIHIELCTKSALERNKAWNNFSDLKMVYGLYATTEDTFTSLVFGSVHTLVRTTPLVIFKINKAEKKRYSFYPALKQYCPRRYKVTWNYFDLTSIFLSQYQWLYEMTVQMDIMYDRGS